MYQQRRSASVRADGRFRGTAWLLERLEVRDLLALVVTPPSLVVAGSPINNYTIATFEATDVQATDTSDYSASINWGNGNVTAGLVQQDGDHYDVIGSNTYTQPTAPNTYNTITVTATADPGATISNFSTTTVQPAALSGIATNFSASPAVPFTGTVADFQSANPFASGSEFNAMINWGDGTAMTPDITLGVIGSDGKGGFIVQGNHTYAAGGSYTTSVTITDTAGGHSVGTPLIVNGTATVPAPSYFLPISAFVITPVDNPLILGTVIGGFTYNHVIGTGPTPSFTASIYWGNGDTTQGTVTLSGTTSNSSGTYNQYNITETVPTNVYTTPGKYPVTIIVADQAGHTGTIMSTVAATGSIVTAFGTQIGVTPGVPFTGTVATFTDTNPNASITKPTVSISWGNGNQSQGTITGPDANGIYTVTGTNTYLSPAKGPYKISVTITDPTATAPVVAPSTAYVTSSLVVTGTTFAVSPGTPFTGTVATFTDTNPAAATTKPIAVITWDDGHVTSGMVVGPDSNGIFSVVGTNTYAITSDLTSYMVSVQVTDSSGPPPQKASSTAVVSNPITIAAQGTTIGFVPGVPFTGPVATFTDLNKEADSSNLNAYISWGNGTSSRGTVTGPNANGVYTVTGTVDYATMNSPSSYVAQVTIIDPTSAPVTVVTTAMSLTASSLTVIPTTFAVNPDSPFSGTVATFTDPNPTATSSKPTASIDWGNGTVSAGMVTGPDSNGVFSVTGAIYYLTTSPTGKYMVTVTVTDPSGQMGSAVSTALMNVAPLAPTLTGGLDPGGENGPFAALGYSDTNRPTFSGMTTPYALVQLYAKRTDVDATLSLGQTVAGANGAWSLGVGPLSQGIFTITAIVTAPGGSPTGPQLVGTTGLYVIDTTPPAVVGVSSDGHGHVFVEFQDGLSGMSVPSLEQTANYTFANSNGSTLHPVSATVLPNAGLPTDVETVELTEGGKSKSAPKTLRITAAGILDNAGNPLAANYHGGIAPASYLAKSNPVVKLKSPKPKPAKHRS